MNTIETQTEVGLSRPVRLLHISDSHITLADGRDSERKRSLARDRSPIFPNNRKLLAEAEAIARENNFTIVHTGDLIDFVSEANLEYAKKFTDENDVFCAAGNHEFSLYVGEAFEDEAYRNQSLSRVQKAFKNDIRFSVREVGGVNLVAVDNSYYRYDEAQYRALKDVIKQNKPILLFVHIPMFEKTLYDLSMSKGPCAGLVSVPEELMNAYPADRLLQQKADEVTRETTELIRTSSPIKAVFCGHLHYDYEGGLTGRLKQYVTGIGTARIITVV